MKNKIIPILLIIIGIILIISSIFIHNNISTSKNNKKDNPENNTVINRNINEISVNELDDKLAKYIINKLLEEKYNKEWVCNDADIVGIDTEDKFLVNIFIKNDTGTFNKQTILKYENETWSIKYPFLEEGEIDVSSYGGSMGYGM